MIRQAEIEEIIELINKGFDLEILSLELDIPIEQIQFYKQQLQIPKRKVSNLRKKENQSVSK